ncbi:TPA: site-specific integrase [Burkholderia vietnamiensis]|nr:site-specific integrase [Burkholderia vietnamiensis]
MAGTSKKRTSALAPDFRERLIAEATASAERGGQWLTPLCIVAACGARPAELAKGVRLRRGSAPDTIQIVIAGAKVNDKQRRGIPIRQVTISTRTAGGESQPWASHLLELVADGPVRYELPSPSAFSHHVRNASMKLWPRRKSHASPYSFRHALAAEMKTTGTDPVEIARVMGHASTRSQEAYGWRRRRKGGKGPVVSAETSQEPRRTTRDGKLDRFKVASKIKTQVANKAAMLAKLASRPVAAPVARAPSRPRAARP